MVVLFYLDRSKVFDGVPHGKLFKKMRTNRKLAWYKRDILVRSQGLGEENGHQ